MSLRPMPVIAMVAIVMLVAGLTHLVAILTLPKVATRDAYALLSTRFGGGTGIALLPPIRPGDTVVPFRDPAAVQGLCVFDLSKTPLRIKTKTDDGRLLTLSFRTREGAIFYAMTNRAALRETIDIRLVSAQQLKEVEASDAEDQVLPSELRLKAPSLNGMMIATALVSRPSEATEARERIEAISCAPEPLAPPP